MFLVTVVVAGLVGWGLALALPLWAAVPLALCVGLGLGLHDRPGATFEGGED